MQQQKDLEEVPHTFAGYLSSLRDEWVKVTRGYWGDKTETGDRRKEVYLKSHTYTTPGGILTSNDPIYTDIYLKQNLFQASLEDTATAPACSWLLSPRSVGQAPARCHRATKTDLLPHQSNSKLCVMSYVGSRTDKSLLRGGNASWPPAIRGPTATRSSAPRRKMYAG